MIKDFMNITLSIKVFFNKIYQLFMNKHSKRFILNNNVIWKNSKKFNHINSEILCELNGFHSAIISYSYLCNLLAMKYNAKIVAYSATIKSPLKSFLSSLLSSNLKKIYKSFNVSKFVVIRITNQYEQEADMIFESVYPKLKSKKDVEDIEIDGIHIGDLVYDEYLRSERVPSIDILDEKFILSLKNSIKVYVFWKYYLIDHHVRAINVSHCVYNLAIPLRIAVNMDIPVYQFNATNAYRLTKKNPTAYNEFLYFPDQFSKLSKIKQTKGIEEAKKKLERRFLGEVGVDMAYSKKSAYTKVKSDRVLRKSSKIKVLIATHCFFDSPHPYGINLFPDFYEWLSFLGKVSEKTDYDWYIKTHPDFLPGNKEILNKFIEKYPKFTFLPSDTSHKQIIKEGINYALTVYGTIGFEYAALGVPVITASICNPTIAYNFNIHPKTIEEYSDVLMNLKSQEITINKNQVYQYYYMKFIHNNENWLFNNYSEMISELGGYENQFKLQVYDYFLRDLTEEKHNKICKTINNFIESGDFHLNKSHIH